MPPDPPPLRLSVGQERSGANQKKISFFSLQHLEHVFFSVLKYQTQFRSGGDFHSNLIFSLQTQKPVGCFFELHDSDGHFKPCDFFPRMCVIPLMLIHTVFLSSIVKCPD